MNAPGLEQSVVFTCAKPIGPTLVADTLAALNLTPVPGVSPASAAGVLRTGAPTARSRSPRCLGDEAEPPSLSPPLAGTPTANPSVKISVGCLVRVEENPQARERARARRGGPRAGSRAARLTRVAPRPRPRRARAGPGLPRDGAHRDGPDERAHARDTARLPRVALRNGPRNGKAGLSGRGREGAGFARARHRAVVAGRRRVEGDGGGERGGGGVDGPGAAVPRACMSPPPTSRAQRPGVVHSPRTDTTGRLPRARGRCKNYTASLVLPGQPDPRNRVAHSCEARSARRQRAGALSR